MVKENRMSLASGCACPQCAVFIAPGLHPRDKKSFSPVSRIWHLVCEECSRQFDILESRLDFVPVSEQWLQQFHSLDLEAMILAARQGSTSQLGTESGMGCLS